MLGTIEMEVTMEFLDVPEPRARVAEVGVAQPRFPPAQQVLFYESADWEEFVREWVTGLRRSYYDVQLVGGSGDQGVDVAGFRTAAKHDGPWDCYQAKHYAATFNWSDLLPEIIKIFRHASLGDYTLPDQYVLASPKGVGGALGRLINQPHAMKNEFLLDAPKKLKDDADAVRIIAMANNDSFERFRVAQLADMVDVHRTTPYFASRFGQPLPTRIITDVVPDGVQVAESRYVHHLLNAYNERWSHSFTPEAAMLDGRSRAHFQRQRVRFFQAEALENYARDAVLPGTYERFQDDIYSGVIDVVEQDHGTGYERLQAALSTAGQLTLNSHSLIAVAGQDDLKGVCHQLANQDRLKWVDES
jgi:hypothetical protein